MADYLDIQIDTSDLEKKLDAVSNAIKKELLAAALTESGRVLQASIKQAVIDRAPRGASGEPLPYKDPNGNSITPGLLAEDIDIDPYVKGTGLSGDVEIGATDLTAHVARWINDGWVHTHGGYRKSKSHKNGKGIEDGQIPGTHFMEAGFDEAAQAATDAFTSLMVQGIEDAYKEG